MLPHAGYSEPSDQHQKDVGYKNRQNVTSSLGLGRIVGEMRLCYAFQVKQLASSFMPCLHQFCF